MNGAAGVDGRRGMHGSRLNVKEAVVQRSIRLVGSTVTMERAEIRTVRRLVCALWIDRADTLVQHQWPRAPIAVVAPGVVAVVVRGL